MTEGWVSGCMILAAYMVVGVIGIVYASVTRNGRRG